MGQEITGHHFELRDFRQFERSLRKETDLLHAWIEDDCFSTREAIAGLELEAWLITPDGSRLAALGWTPKFELDQTLADLVGALDKGAEGR